MSFLDDDYLEDDLDDELETPEHGEDEDEEASYFEEDNPLASYDDEE